MATTEDLKTVLFTDSSKNEIKQENSNVKLSHCKTCDFTAETNLKLKRHVVCWKFCCSICGFLTSVDHVFASHRLSKHNKNPKVCSECGQWFPDKKLLSVHIKSHKPKLVVPLHCHLCDTEPKHLLSEHYFRGYQESEGKFKCEICSFTTQSKNRIEDHLEKSRPCFKQRCPKCDYTSRSTLNGHKCTGKGNKIRESSEQHYTMNSDGYFSCLQCSFMSKDK